MRSVKAPSPIVGSREPDAPVSALVTNEGDLAEKVEDDEVEVGLGPEG